MTPPIWGWPWDLLSVCHHSPRGGTPVPPHCPCRGCAGYKGHPCLQTSPPLCTPGCFPLPLLQPQHPRWGPPGPPTHLPRAQTQRWVLKADTLLRSRVGVQPPPPWGQWGGTAAAGYLGGPQGWGAPLGGLSPSVLADEGQPHLAAHASPAPIWGGGEEGDSALASNNTHCPRDQTQTPRDPTLNPPGASSPKLPYTSHQPPPGYHLPTPRLPQHPLHPPTGRGSQHSPPKALGAPPAPLTVGAEGGAVAVGAQWVAMQPVRVVPAALVSPPAVHGPALRRGGQGHGGTPRHRAWGAWGTTG